MSGGVDSSLAAKLMKDAGYDCIGCTMKLYDNEDIGMHRGHTCCSLDDVEDARSVAYKIGIPYYVFNFKEGFRENVIKHFVEAYESGKTPNPCIDCNRYMKFDKLFERARILGCDCVVTGHYARIDDFINASKPDSQDICFVPDGDYGSFLERYTGKCYAPGAFLDLEGNVLGTHNGTIHYTIGQRKGLGITLGKPMYVKEIDAGNNTVTLAEDRDLYGDKLTAADFNWISGEAPAAEVKCQAKIRYRQQEQPAIAYPMPDGTVNVTFEHPQRAITPGQAVVLYDGDIVLGGGRIV